MSPAPWQPLFRPETPVAAEGENVFVIIARCRRLARQLEWPQEWIEAFTARVAASQSYEEALAVVREHFTLEDDHLYAPAEIEALKQQLRRGNEEIAKAASERGYKPHPKVAALRGESDA